MQATDRELYDFEWETVPTSLIWIEICKLNAFTRVYGLFLKKKLSAYSVLKVLLILYFNIPLKLIKLFQSLVMSDNGNIRDSLTHLHLMTWTSCRALKIETLGGKIFLNCFSLEKFITECRRLQPNITKNECLNTVNGFQILFKNKKIWEQEWRAKYFIFRLSTLKLNNNIKISPHFAYKHQGILVHATSNTNFPIYPLQRIGVSMPEATKEKSQKPGTMWSLGGEELTKGSKIRQIPEFELEISGMDNLDWVNVSLEKQIYYNDIKEEISNIFKKSMRMSPLSEDSIYKEIIVGHYAPLLQMMSLKEIQDIIDTEFEK
jgi:hypothetical protein